MEWFIAICLVITIGAVLFTAASYIGRTKYVNEAPSTLPPRPQASPAPPSINVQKIDLEPLRKEISNIPNKVLKSIQGSNNNGRGALGELIGYTQLKAEYDRIIPLGNIVDFMCIKFPRDGEEGKVDLVDIKTGKYARLNDDQKKLQKLIKEKKINFLEMSVTLDETQSRTD